MTLYFLSQCSNVLLVEIHFLLRIIKAVIITVITLNCTYLEQDLSRFKRLHVHVGAIHLDII